MKNRLFHHVQQWQKLINYSTIIQTLNQKPSKILNQTIQHHCKPPLHFILHTKLYIYTLVCKKSVKFSLRTQIYIPNCTNNIWYVKFKQNSVSFFSLYIPKCIINIWYVFIANFSSHPKTKYIPNCKFFHFGM